jgi:hypothetical protein
MFDATVSQVSSAQNASNLSAPYGRIGGLFGGLAGVSQTANSTSAGVVSNTQGNSFTVEETGTGPGDYNYFNPNNVTEVNGGTGGPTGSIELYGFQEVSGRGANLTPNDLGSFSLNSSGVLTYNGINAAAVPEPSAYALGICAILLFIVLKRRHSVA